MLTRRSPAEVRAYIAAAMDHATRTTGARTKGVGVHTGQTIQRRPQRAFAALLERDRYHHVRIWKFNVFVVVPGEGEHQPFRRHDLLEHAVLPEMRAVLRRLKAVTPFPADAQIHVHLDGGAHRRAPPVLGVIRIGPRLPDKLARRLEDARDDKLLLGERQRAGGC